MKTNTLTDLQTRLQDIPEGTYLINRTDASSNSRHTDTISSQQKAIGKGMMEEYHVFPGIVLTYHCILGDEIDLHHDALHSSLEINHCNRGRIGIHMKDHQKVFLGEGDMALQPMDCCADADITLPLGFYEGIMITINLDELICNPPDFLMSETAAGKVLFDKFCSKDEPVAIPANHRIEHIFCELYQVPSTYKIPYIKLKVVELILFLCLLEPEEEIILNPYRSDQVEVIKEVHQKLVSNLGQRYTIDELSAEYLMNATTLKNTFKNIYGLPIASYMK